MTTEYISYSERKILECLEASDELCMTIKEILEVIKITRGSTGRILWDLNARGYVIQVVSRGWARNERCRDIPPGIDDSPMQSIVYGSVHDRYVGDWRPILDLDRSDWDDTLSPFIGKKVKITILEEQE